MSDLGFLVRELEPSFLQEMGHERLDLITKKFLRCACDQEVIRIADQVDFGLPLSFRRVREAFRQQPLQSIQGPIRQRGGSSAPNNVAKSSLIPDSVISRTRLRPKYGQG